MEMEKTIIEKAVDLLKDVDLLAESNMSWSEFEAEYGVRYGSIGEMIDISINANLYIDAKYTVFDQEQMIYYTIDESRKVVEITEVEYFKEFLDYVSLDQ